MTYQEFQKRYRYNPTTDRIGKGGFGVVFKAYDNYLEQRQRGDRKTPLRILRNH